MHKINFGAKRNVNNIITYKKSISLNKNHSARDLLYLSINKRINQNKKYFE